VNRCGEASGSLAAIVCFIVVTRINAGLRIRRVSSAPLLSACHVFSAVAEHSGIGGLSVAACSQWSHCTSVSYWLSEQIMCTTPSGHEHRGNPMSWGLPIRQQGFPDKRVFPVVVVHSHDGGEIATNNRNRGTNPILMTPLQFVDQVGRLCVDQQAKTVDGVALSKLVSMMSE